MEKPKNNVSFSSTISSIPQTDGCYYGISQRHIRRGNLYKKNQKVILFLEKKIMYSDWTCTSYTVLNKLLKSGM